MITKIKTPINRIIPFLSNKPTSMLNFHLRISLRAQVSASCTHDSKRLYFLVRHLTQYFYSLESVFIQSYIL